MFLNRTLQRPEIFIAVRSEKQNGRVVPKTLSVNRADRPARLADNDGGGSPIPRKDTNLKIQLASGRSQSAKLQSGASETAEIVAFRI